MAIKFTDLKGKAGKGGPERMKFVDGKNVFRIVSPIVPGYKYWLKTKDGQSVPMDCLSFDREKESFTNVKKDYVREYFPDLKCQWAYSCFVIDRADNKLKLLDLKKTLLQSIIDAAKKKFGDPSDPEKGWDILVSRVKTGPKVFNVEYKLEIFDIENAPLSDNDKKLVAEMPDIEEVLRLPSPEEQEKFIKEYILGEGDNTDSADEDVDDLEDDEIAF
jgi:hypothetical protein